MSPEEGLLNMLEALRENLNGTTDDSYTITIVVEDGRLFSVGKELSEKAVQKLAAEAKEVAELEEMWDQS